MAGEPSYTSTDPTKSAMDYPAHDDTYAGFMQLVKVGVVGCILAVLSLLLVHLGWPIAAILLALGTLVGCIVVLVVLRNGAQT